MASRSSASDLRERASSRRRPLKVISRSQPVRPPPGRAAINIPDPGRPMTRRVRATPYLFLFPAVALIGVFVVYPIVAVIYYSFTDYDIVRPPVWIGFDNYAHVLADKTFWLALTHSIIYLLVTPTLIALSIGLAIFVN